MRSRAMVATLTARRGLWVQVPPNAENPEEASALQRPPSRGFRAFRSLLSVRLPGLRARRLFSQRLAAYRW